MNTLRLQELLKQGENQRLEFKSEQINAAGLAKEMVAFANTHGGIILLGVEDDGTVSGIQRTEPTLEGNKRQENPDFPDEAIREALVNAVAHRDYSIVNQRTTVYLFSDRLEITSPGGLPNTLTLEKIKIGNSAPRNLFLIKYLDNLRYIDGLGRGVPRMSRLLGNRFRLEEVGILFRLTFFR